MKPRTKREKLVVELSSKLPAITETQIRWGKKHCFPHNAYRCKDEMWCSECGKMWVDVTGQKEGYIKCPYCGERLEVKVSRKTKDNAVSYLTVVTTSGDFQVLRHFYTAKYARKERDTHYFIDEVCQQWITADRKETVMAKAMNMGYRGWLHGTDMSIKQDGNIYYSHSYDIDGYVYPKVKLLPILHRNGLRTSFHGVTPARLIRAILGESKYAEMLLKTKQYSMLDFYMHRGGLSHPWAVNICNRNGYIIKDGSMYDDYLHLLDYFHLDTHNAHYVCPKNLKKEHDKLVEKKRKIEAKTDTGTELKRHLPDVGGAEFFFSFCAIAGDLRLEAAQIFQFHNFTLGNMLVDLFHQGTDHVQHVSVGEGSGVRDFFGQFVDVNASGCLCLRIILCRCPLVIGVFHLCNAVIDSHSQ